MEKGAEGEREKRETANWGLKSLGENNQGGEREREACFITAEFSYSLLSLSSG